MRKLFILLVIVFSSSFSFAALKFLVKPGIDIYSDCVGFNGTTGGRFYFSQRPEGPCIGAQGLVTYAVWNTYSVLERGAAGDIGFTFNFNNKSLFTPHILAGIDFLSMLVGGTNTINLTGLYGELGVEYEAKVNETVGIGLDIGYRIFLSDSMKADPFVRMVFSQDLF